MRGSVCCYCLVLVVCCPLLVERSHVLFACGCCVMFLFMVYCLLFGGLPFGAVWCLLFCVLVVCYVLLLFAWLCWLCLLLVVITCCFGVV